MLSKLLYSYIFPFQRINKKKKTKSKKKHVTYISEASGSQLFRLFKLLLSEGARKKKVNSVLV